MAKIGRPGLPSDKRQQVWELWKAGRSIRVISQTVGSPAGSTSSILLPFGGIYQPPQRRRVTALTAAEREEISRGLAAQESLRAIGRQLGRPASTISREIARNHGVAKYRATDADDRAWRRAKRPKPCLLPRRPALATYVRDRLREDWSPEQIAGTLRKHYPAGSAMRVSHETIHRTLFVESRGVLARELRAHLRSGRPLRPSVHNTTTGQWRSQIEGASPSPSDRSRWRIGRCLATAKATCSWAGTGRSSRRWSSAPRASRCSCSSPGVTCRP